MKAIRTYLKKNQIKAPQLQLSRSNPQLGEFEQGIMEYLTSIFIENPNEMGITDLLRFMDLKSYYCSQPHEDLFIHNFEFEIKQGILWDTVLHHLKENPFLQQDDNDPKPTWTHFFGTIYINIYGLA